MNLFAFLKTLWNTPPRHSISHRRYDGAKRGRLHADWQAAGTSANTEVYSSLATLRNRSRDLLRNNDYARGILRNIVDNVVYTGIGFQAQVKQLIDKAKNDERINNALETAWKNWTVAEYCDVTGVSGFGDIQQLVLRSVLESGEVFVRKVRNPDYRGTRNNNLEPRAYGLEPNSGDIPFALEVIEADRCAEDFNSTYNGNQVVMGVEINAWKRPVAYWFYNYHPGDFWLSTSNTNVRDRVRVPADEIIHLYIRERPNQLRGVPILYSAINRLRNLGEYEKSELIAARAAASIMGLVTTPDIDLLSEPKLDGSDEAGKLPADEQLSPGMMRYLAPGEKFEGFSPSRPNSAFANFFESQLRGTGAGVGVSYENVSNDFSKSNYSSSRLSLLQARDRWAVLQLWFISSFLRHVYCEWLDMAVLSGVLNFPDYEMRPERYKEIRWTPRGWSWVDPHKEVQATIAAIECGLTTLTAEIAKQGGDFEENVKIMAREKEILERYGVGLNFK